MKTKNFGHSIKKTVKRFAKAVDKHSPTLLIVAGTAGVIVGAYLAFKAGTNAEEALEESAKELEAIHEKKDLVTSTNGACIPEYSEEDYKKDLIRAYFNRGLDYVKLYGPAVVTLTASLAMMITSHKIQKTRNAKCCAAIAAMSKAYDNYRKRVIDELGEEADRKFRLGIKAVDITEPLLNKHGEPKLDKDGNPKYVTRTHEVIEDFDDADPRTVLWDEHTAPEAFCFDSDDVVRHDSNLTHICLVQRSLNSMLLLRLKANRFKKPAVVTLNEARKLLGVRELDIGDFLGWVLDVDSPDFKSFYHVDANGEDYVTKINFGLSDETNPNYERVMAFVDGDEDAVVLNMNYDGVIFDVGRLKTKGGRELMRRIKE